ncbi:sensor histidine kinase [Anaerotalea alkaliphila]|uniref:histidine kinase n=1 Tax=Anaerotalea alkaliphila TaxID=2662126 RepID=A0A7X5HWS0_9FIRM|nr:HAMP domain-containing sensor histidine kinase [Anaerotalea alkaliphila]NDL68062.1 cell wall metabolism sensor histidine kinase WalK [Anaerotalea alkaliphila]
MKSIRLRLLLHYLFFVCLMGTVLYVGLHYRLEDYYYGKKVAIMQGTVEDIERLFRLSRSEDEALSHMEYLGYGFEGKITLIDRSSNLLLFENQGSWFLQGSVEKEVVYRGTKAYVVKTSMPVEGTRWLVYGEEIQGGKIAVLQIPVSAMEDTIGIVQSFSIGLVGIAMAAAVFLSLVLSRNITRPIADLNGIAKQMGQLDFRHRYTGKRKDEIGQLGNTLNELTGKLEETIDNLKKELDKEKNLDVMRKKFVAQVSHELQTPITIVNGYLEALSDGMVEGEEEEAYYEIIEDEMEKMSNMVKDLLHLSQLESGTYKMRMEPMDLTSLVRSIAKKFPVLAEKKGLAWREGIGEEAFGFEGDPLRLEQAIANILQNALKYARHSIRLEYAVFNNHAVLEIRNDGERIAEGDLPRIWESFYKGGGQGTGLGLAIAAGIFQYHGVRYGARNLPEGEGVAFRMVFPLGGAQGGPVGPRD